MPNQIYDTPPDTSAGLSFDYSVWSAGTLLSMVNVPFDNTYRDIIDWNAYGTSPRDYVRAIPRKNKIELSKMTYLAQGKPIRIPTPFSLANQFNYVMVENPGRPADMPGFEGYTPTTFFYFITSIDYVAPNTTQLTLQLDVWSTYYSRVKFGRSYLERGHFGVAAEDSFENNGRKWLVQPEGLDVGAEHRIMRTYRQVLCDMESNDYYVVITSTIALAKEFGYGNSSNPSVHMAMSCSAEKLPNGTAIYVCDYINFKNGIFNLANYPWITQGIGSITIVPKNTINTNDLAGQSTIGDGGVKAVWGELGADSVNINTSYPVTQSSFREELIKLIPSEYRELKKFLTSPYLIVEMTSYTGNPLEFRPESIGSQGLEVQQYAHVVPPNPSLMFTLKNYNSNNSDIVLQNNGKVIKDIGEGWDSTTGYTALPTFSTLNNAALNALASSAHTTAAQINNAKWQQQRAQRAATASRDIANAGIAATAAGAENSMWGNSAMADSQSRYNNLRATVQAAQGGIMAAGGALSLNGQAVGSGLAQSATAGINAMISNSQAQSTANIQNQLASGASQISQTQQRKVRDTNYELAQFTANGDYEAAIASINGQRQDMQVIPPSVVGQTSGYLSAIVSQNLVIDCRMRFLSESAMNSVGQYWLRYGYLMNCWVSMPDTLSLMTEFTYWKLVECYLEKADMPEAFKGTVRGIFEKGVTVWQSPDRIGTASVKSNRIDRSVRVRLDG